MRPTWDPFYRKEQMRADDAERKVEEFTKNLGWLVLLIEKLVPEGSRTPEIKANLHDARQLLRRERGGHRW